jgi:hypothetical protein
MRHSAVGKVYPAASFTIDPARVAAFRRVFGQRDGVPVTFVTAAEFTVMPRIVDDPDLGLDFSRVVHGNQEYEFRRPLVEGERLEIRSRIDSIREMGGNSFVVIATDLVGEDGELACAARSTMIERAAS